jgi:hypothetical protein
VEAGTSGSWKCEHLTGNAGSSGSAGTSDHGSIRIQWKSGSSGSAESSGLSGLDHQEVVEHSIMEVVEHQSSGSSGTSISG